MLIMMIVMAVLIVIMIKIRTVVMILHFCQFFALLLDNHVMEKKKIRIL